MKYAWIKSHAQYWGIGRMCETMEVSSSGYYDWLGRRPSDRELANIELDSKIKVISAANDGRCGYRRIFKALRKVTPTVLTVLEDAYSFWVLKQ